MAARKPCPLRRQAGFYYAEVVLSVLLLAILLVPALQALTAAVVGNQAGTLTARQLNLQSKMEEVLAQPFAALYAETYQSGGNNSGSVNATYSDAAGTPDRRVVLLYRYDANAQALSSNDTGLLYVGVYYQAEGANAALSTLKGRWW